MINTGGIKLFAEQLEAEITKALAPTPFATLNFYITSEPDPKWGQRVVMVVENDADGRTSAPEIIIESLKASMPSVHIPKHIISVPEFARTANGKIRRVLPM